MSDLKVFTLNVEPEAWMQINTLLAQPAFSNCKVRIMPDVHTGKGCVIGFTADLGDKVIPNIVGVDIGCGMLTVKLGKIDVDYKKLDSIIREKVPSGREVHDNIYWSDPGTEINYLRCIRELKNINHLYRSLGTLGGGNHFIELDENEEGEKYLVIHTGSRNLGKQVAEYYQNLAIEQMSGKEMMRELESTLITHLKNSGRAIEISEALNALRNGFKWNSNIPVELSYLTGGYRKAYLHDMGICQRFAKFNRIAISTIICDAMDWTPVGMFDTIHNYIDSRLNIVRKGAVSALIDEPLLIPMNMRDGSLICRGKGNPDWNYSAPHGAGRIMSRKKAKETLSLEDYKASMEGIYTTSVDTSTIDEAPMAYKPMEEIIANIQDTVEIREIIKPVYNFKAGE